MVGQEFINTDVSPRASGPAGSQFEVKVATHYALALLAQTEAFGLPGAVAEEITFQRGAQGHPLDDIILKGLTTSGKTRILDLQAKRSIAFTAGDAKFGSVVKAIVETRRDVPNGRNRRYAVALERTSGAIENGVQEALELARSVESGEAFYTLLNTPGRCNDGMRHFVAAFRTHLKKNGIVDENELFAILTRFSVLVFDYARPNSIAEAHDRMRAKHLASAKADRDLYDSLHSYILRLDSIGGGKTRAGLVAELQDLGVSIIGAPQLARARARINEMSVLALLDINETVQDVPLIRLRRNNEVEVALDKAMLTSGVVEILGPGGAGKSALMKVQAQRWGEACRVLVFSPDRTPQGGWPALRHALEIDSDGEYFFADIACDGGGLVCIDGLDQFRNPGERKTIIDVLRFATCTRGMAVLYTARPVQDAEPLAWLPDDVRDTLASRRTVFVGQLDDEEAEALGRAAPNLATLLKSDHPARALARNPFILRQLAETRLNIDGVCTEAQLANDWWMTGGHGFDVSSSERRARRRVLAEIARATLGGASNFDVSSFDADVVNGLLENEVFTELGPTDLVKFRHDVFADWVLGCYLSEDADRIDELALNTPPPYWLSRGFELACRCIAEGTDETTFSAILDRLSEDAVAPAWLGIALLALVRSEQGEILLNRYSNILLHDDGSRGAVLIRRALAAHGSPAARSFANFLPKDVVVPDGLMLPFGPVWPRLVVWTASRFDRLPGKTLAAAIELYEQWMTISLFVVDPITANLLEHVADLLVAHVEDDYRPIKTAANGKPQPIRYPVSSESVSAARIMIALHAHRAPGAAARYLNAVAASDRAARYMNDIFEFVGNLPRAAPAAFAAAVRSAVEKDAKAVEDISWSDRRHNPFLHLDGPFALGRAGIGLFCALIKADEAVGISLIRDLLRHAEQWVSGEAEGFELDVFGELRRVEPHWSYGWSRGTGESFLLSESLAALEHWGHEEVEAGRALEDVVAQILGNEEISGALLLVAVDLVLSHGKLASPILWDLVASPETLSLDAERSNHDTADKMSDGSLYLRSSVGSTSDRKIKEELSSRLSRSVVLHDVIQQIALRVQEIQLQPLRDRLERAVKRLGPWARENVDWTSPVFMASHALRLASRENYEKVRETDAGGRQIKGWRFVWPEQQRRWLESESAKATANHEFLSKSLAVRMAMDDDQRAVKATVEMANEVLAETVDAKPSDDDEPHDPNDPWIKRVAAAAFVARYGSDSILLACRADLTLIFDQALAHEAGPSFYRQSQIMYDPKALAITGLLYLASRSGDTDDLRRLLNALSQHCSSAAAAFLGHREAVKALGACTVQAAVRIGIETSVFARQAHFDEDPRAYAGREETVQTRRSERLTAEITWLLEKGESPSWVCPPPHRTRRPRRSLTIPGRAPKRKLPRRQFEWPDLYFDDRTAADWTRCLTVLGAEAADAVKALIIANKEWLIHTNAADEHTDESDVERTWTRALMERAAEHAKAWSAEERSMLVFDILVAFSDEAFIDAAAAFLVQSDLHHIDGAADDTAYLVELRKAIWALLKDTSHWRWHLTSSSFGMEIHLKELITTFFFKISYGFGAEQSYTGGLREDQLVPLFPVLTEIAVDANSSLVTALLFLDALETVDAQVAAPFVLDAAAAWVSNGSTRFWNEFGIGRRVCLLLRAAQISPEDVAQLLTIADAVSAAGVAEGETLRVAFKDLGG